VTTAHDLGADTLTPINPATLEPVGAVAVTSPEALSEVVSEARAAQTRWGRTDAEERARVLRAARAVLLECTDEIAATIVAETGKPLVEAFTSELFVSLDHASWLARNAGRTLREERLRLWQPYVVQKRAMLHYDPIGVVGIVAPWNFPLGVPFTQVASAVAAGNAAVVKPSELSPLTGAWLEEIFRRAGAPSGLVRVVQGGGAVGAALVRHHGIDGIVFTGSTETGRDVAAAAGERLVPVVLELGGKDPMLVLDDADVDRAVDGALWGSFTNCGQVCSGIERVYVAAPLYQEFVAALAARAASLRIGAGDAPDTDLGPLVTEAQRARVEALIADACAHGARVVTGGNRPQVGLPGWFLEPTVLEGEPEASRVRTDEIFGPVVTVVRFDNNDEGIRLANHSRYGLGASVWSRDRARAARVARSLAAGSVWVNDHAYSYGVCQAPWGGRGLSGYGRTHSKHGLYAMCHVKYVDADRGRLTPPWWYPYGRESLDAFRGVFGALYGDRLSARVRAVGRHRRALAGLARRMVQ
jgi:succinate-semialdehyde dehydrogenase/glutarate-semialdehyde dehydrogenase